MSSAITYFVAPNHETIPGVPNGSRTLPFPTVVSALEQIEVVLQDPDNTVRIFRIVMFSGSHLIGAIDLRNYSEINSTSVKISFLHLDRDTGLSNTDVLGFQRSNALTIANSPSDFSSIEHEAVLRLDDADAGFVVEKTALEFHGLTTVQGDLCERPFLTIYDIDSQVEPDTTALPSQGFARAVRCKNLYSWCSTAAPVMIGTDITPMSRYTDGTSDVKPLGWFVTRFGVCPNNTCRLLISGCARRTGTDNTFPISGNFSAATSCSISIVPVSANARSSWGRTTGQAFSTCVRQCVADGVERILLDAGCFGINLFQCNVDHIVGPFVDAASPKDLLIRGCIITNALFGIGISSANGVSPSNVEIRNCSISDIGTNPFAFGSSMINGINDYVADKFSLAETGTGIFVSSQASIHNNSVLDCATVGINISATPHPSFTASESFSSFEGTQTTDDERGSFIFNGTTRTTPRETLSAAYRSMTDLQNMTELTGYDIGRYRTPLGAEDEDQIFMWHTNATSFVPIIDDDMYVGHSGSVVVFVDFSQISKAGERMILGLQCAPNDDVAEGIPSFPPVRSITVDESPLDRPKFEDMNHSIQAVFRFVSTNTWAVKLRINNGVSTTESTEITFSSSVHGFVGIAMEIFNSPHSATQNVTIWIMNPSEINSSGDRIFSMPDAPSLEVSPFWTTLATWVLTDSYHGFDDTTSDASNGVLRPTVLFGLEGSTKLVHTAPIFPGFKVDDDNVRPQPPIFWTVYAPVASDNASSCTVANVSGSFSGSDNGVATGAYGNRYISGPLNALALGKYQSYTVDEDTLEHYVSDGYDPSQPSTVIEDWLSGASNALGSDHVGLTVPYVPSASMGTISNILQTMRLSAGILAPAYMRDLVNEDTSADLFSVDAIVIGTNGGASYSSMVGFSPGTSFGTPINATDILFIGLSEDNKVSPLSSLFNIASLADTVVVREVLETPRTTVGSYVVSSSITPRGGNSQDPLAGYIMYSLQANTLDEGAVADLKEQVYLTRGAIPPRIVSTDDRGYNYRLTNPVTPLSLFFTGLFADVQGQSIASPVATVTVEGVPETIAGMSWSVVDKHGSVIDGCRVRVDPDDGSKIHISLVNNWQRGAFVVQTGPASTLKGQTSSALVITNRIVFGTSGWQMEPRGSVFAITYSGPGGLPERHEDESPLGDDYLPATGCSAGCT